MWPFKKHVYPDCRIKKYEAIGEYGRINNIWNINGWKGDFLLLRNKTDIFKIFISFPDEFIKDYYLETVDDNLNLYYGEWVKKKWYKKKRIFKTDKSYEGKRSFERV